MEERILEQIESNVRAMKCHASKILDIGLEIEQLLVKLGNEVTQHDVQRTAIQPAQQALFTPEADTAKGKLPTPASRR